MRSERKFPEILPSVCIETAVRPGSVALATPEGRISWTLLPREEDQASRLIPLLDELLLGEGISKGDIKLVVVGTGPGSFTGVRAGIATANVISRYGGAKLVALCSLDGSPVIGKSRFSAVCMDALRGEVQGCIYEKGKCIFGPFLGDPAVFAEKLPNEGVIAGTGVRILEKEGLLKQGWKVEGEEDNIPRADYLLRKGMERGAAGEFDKPGEIQPLYLRLPAAMEKGR